MDAAENRRADRVMVFVETELRRAGEPTDLVNSDDLWCPHWRQSTVSEARFVTH